MSHVEKTRIQEKVNAVTYSKVKKEDGTETEERKETV